MLRLCQSCDARIRDIANKVLQLNCYFAHSENALINMLYDSRPHVRKLALLRIKKISEVSPTNTRKFKLPKLNFDATEYFEMINWQTEKFTFLP